LLGLAWRAVRKPGCIVYIELRTPDQEGRTFAS
jgi:hypothetical protein